MLETTVPEVAHGNDKVKQKRARKQQSPLSYSSVHRTQMAGVLARLDGRFLCVDFVKQDGSLRKLNGRLGVRAHLRGGVNTTVADSRPYVTVFDVRALEYRAVNMATVCSVRADRHVYSIIG